MPFVWHENNQAIHIKYVKFLMFVNHPSENVKHAFDFKILWLLLMFYFWGTMNTLNFYKNFPYIIEFMVVILVNIIIQVSCEQF